jgi:biopolymer transport protein TolR
MAMGALGGGNGKGVGAGARRGYRPMSEINVTPMVDVMLVLLVIFMITAPLLNVGVPLRLPKSQAAVVNDPKKPLILSLNSSGETFIGDAQIAPGALADRLAALAAENPDRTVFVRGDRTITYAELMHALGLVNKAGFVKVSLLAEPAHSP